VVIVRQVRCTLTEGNLPPFLEHARQVVADHIGRIDGLVMLELAVKHLGRGQVSVVAQSHWRDFATMQAYLQQHLYQPALWDPENKWLTAAEVEHYEVVAREADLSQLEATEGGTPAA
jgi:hypothetical protein